jgi:hypothetical protein
MPRPRILVINPNSNVIVTKGLEVALQPLDFTDGPEIVCATLDDGPYGVESQADVDSVTMPLRRLVESDNSSAAFVIACYSDPGLHVCREGTDRPVFGIAECGVLTAMMVCRGEVPQLCSTVDSLAVRRTSTGWLSGLRSNLVRDLLCPRIYVGPLAVVARVPAESLEQQPSPCGPVIEINDTRKDAIVARVNRLFELADFSGLLLH